MSKRVWKYCRQANPDALLTGLHRQNCLLDEYIADNAFVLVGSTNVIGPAVHMNRESLNEVLNAAKERKFDILLIHNMDRICRNAQAVKDFSESLRLCGVTVVSYL